MAPSIFSQDSSLLPNTAAFLGLVPTFLSINTILRPRSALGQLQFPAPRDPEAQRLVDNLMRMHGGRDMALGLSMLIARYSGHRKVLGYMMVLGVVVSCVDGWVSKLQVGKGEWINWSFALLFMGLGGDMLGWFGGD